MKISAKTLKAARKAASDQGVSLDNWADAVLAHAASEVDHQANVGALLREISSKVDQIADRQSLGERANEQLAATIRDIGSTFQRATKRTRKVLGEVGTRTSSAVGDMAGKALEAIGQMTRPAADASATPASPGSAESKGRGPSEAVKKPVKSDESVEAKAARRQSAPRRRSQSDRAKKQPSK